MSYLVGTGFYATEQKHKEAEAFFCKWVTDAPWCDKFVVVDNSERGLLLTGSRFQVVSVEHNLGHVCGTMVPAWPLLGWSMSWILPALIAYSEGMDFVYKEQDCRAFNDWLPEIVRGRGAFGRNTGMPCEQSLFYLKHESIVPFVAAYMALPKPDAQEVPEQKFITVAQSVYDVGFFDMPCGRDRPIPVHSRKPFYAQKITENETKDLRNAGYNI